MSDSRDRELGMHRDISRRDFLNGIALAAGAAMAPSELWSMFGPEIPYRDQNSPNYYPPALTGLRGSHPGSFEVAHSLRDGDFWERAGKPLETGEKYDLVIVGGGISKRAEKWLPLLKTRVPLVPAQFLNEAGIIGAAMSVHDLVAA